MNRLQITVFLSVVLTACNAQQPENADTAEQRQPLTEAVHAPLEKAKGVEQMLMEQAEAQKKQAEGL